jgi:hypothetical protein
MMDRKLIAVVGMVLALGLIAPAMAAAASFNVNTPTDSTVAGGCTTDPVCSLRDAVAAASASPDPEDRVEIPAGHYLLTAGQLKAEGSGTVTIHGAGARSTSIDAGGASRVFKLMTPKIAIEGLTITGGLTTAAELTEFAGDGGGILVVNNEQLTLNQVTITGNTASQNGAGVSAPPESVTSTAVTINASTISGNRVTGGAIEGLGGGVYTLGDLTIVNSTITGNSIDNAVGTNQGGGVLVGIDPANTAGTKASVLNSTIAGNSVSAGGIGGGLTVYNPTVGVTTALEVKNTIVAGNTVGGAAGNCGAVAMVTSSNNLSSDASCMFSDAGSRQNTDPQLSALANNGGPTDTMALPAGSPAIDAGTNAGCPATDQRGVTRPQGSACDIGAFEREVAPPAPPSADLRMRLKAKPKRPIAGHRFAFLLTLANSGPSAAPGVVIKGTAAAAALKITGKKVGGKRPCKLSKAKHGKRKFVCRLGTVNAGARAKLKVVVKTSNDAKGKLRVAARARSGVTDPTLKNNRAKAAVKLRAG